MEAGTKQYSEIHRVLRSHRSIRKYKPDPVPDEMLSRILASAVRASSSGNMQSYSIIVTRDRKVREQLHKAHFNQGMVLEAPIVVTFCADFHRMRQWLSIRNAPVHFDNFMSFMAGTIDATLAAQNAAIAAEAEGLGICFMGSTLISCNEIAQILECPANVVPVVGFCLGFPAEKPDLRDRLPLKGVVHRDKYHTQSADEIVANYREKETTGWTRYLSHPPFKQLVERTGVSNLAQLYSRVKFTRESHLQYTLNVFRCLRRQNFMNNEPAKPK